MEDRYIRNIGAISEADAAKLNDKKVFVAGCGGLGGHIIDLLLRIGIGAISCADGDFFEESNLNRQLLSSAENIGASKAEAAAQYAKKVNPGVKFHAEAYFVNEDNARQLIYGCDAVIDALDSIASRKILKGACDELGIPYIYGAVQGWTAQAAVSMPKDGLLDMLYPHDGAESENMSILAFTPSLCAALQVSLCVRLLIGRDFAPGHIYCFDLEDLEFIDLLRS